MNKKIKVFLMIINMLIVAYLIISIPGLMYHFQIGRNVGMIDSILYNFYIYIYDNTIYTPVGCIYTLFIMPSIIFGDICIGVYTCIRKNIISTALILLNSLVALYIVWENLRVIAYMH